MVLAKVYDFVDVSPVRGEVVHEEEALDILELGRKQGDPPSYVLGRGWFIRHVCEDRFMVAEGCSKITEGLGCGVPFVCADLVLCLIDLKLSRC